MQIIERKRGSYKPMVFNVDLTGIEKLYSDVSEIFFVIKEKVTDADADAIMLKTAADGITIDADSQVQVPWGTNEYVDFVINKRYVLGLFLQFSGAPVADEDVREDFSIVITQDLLQDN